MSSVPITDSDGAARKVDTITRTDGGATVETQAVAVIDPGTGTPIDFATQATVAALLTAAQAIQAAAEALNTKTIPVDGPLTDAELRATPLPVDGPLTDAELRATPLATISDADLLEALYTIHARLGILETAKHVDGSMRITSLGGTVTTVGNVANITAEGGYSAGANVQCFTNNVAVLSNVNNCVG